MIGQQPVSSDNTAVSGLPPTVTIGTRGSKLALAQTHMIRDALQAAWPDLTVHIEIITTKGDIILDRPLNMIGDKGLFVTEIEDAMRAGRVDLAVHSAKDLPSELPPDMALACVPAREDARDALLTYTPGQTLASLPDRANVGTSSLRRGSQLRALRPDLNVTDLRGNVDTRLRKLREGQYDAIVLAAAGLNRLSLDANISELLDPAVMLPAVAQGALGIEARAGDTAVAALLAPLEDATTRMAVTAERAFLARIGGGCQVPIGAYATTDGQMLTLYGLIADRQGTSVRGSRQGRADDPTALGVALAEELLERGGAALIGR